MGCHDEALEPLTCKQIVILARLSDETIHQVVLTKEQYSSVVDYIQAIVGGPMPISQNAVEGMSILDRHEVKP